jgi:hypothetical protein
MRPTALGNVQMIRLTVSFPLKNINSRFATIRVLSCDSDQECAAALDERNRILLTERKVGTKLDLVLRQQSLA